MAQYLQHIASEGDRWDSISYQYYGDALAYENIIVANKHLSISPTLEAGQIVFIPIIEPPNTSNGIPVWLQDDDAEHLIIDEVVL